MWLLKGRGGASDPVEVDELAVVARLLFRPERLARLDPLPEDREPALWIRAVVGHLLEIPAGADAEDHPPPREAIHRRHLLGGEDRIALYQQADRIPDLDPLSGRGHGPERHERVEDAEVLARQLTTGWIGRLPARGDVGVLGDEDGLEPPVLRQASEVGRCYRLIGGEIGDPEVHGPDPFRPAR